MQTHTKDHTSLRRSLPFWIALVALLLFATTSFGVVQGATPTEPEEATPAAEATDTAPAVEATDATPEPSPVPVTDEPGTSGFDPFPGSEAMTETIQAALDAYQVPGAERDIASTRGPIEVQNHWHLSQVFLPSIRGRASAQPTPTPIVRVVPADMAVSIWPAPSIRVARGGTIAYEIRVKNYGQGTASSLSVRLPYLSQQLTPVDSRFTKAGDWVSGTASDGVTVTFGRVLAGEYRTATLSFRVSNILPDNMVINMRAEYSWRDDGAGGSGKSNWAPLLVGSGNDSAQWMWMRVEPVSGYAGTSHQFYSDRFIPGEGIITWLNTPSGSQPLTLRGQADLLGGVKLDWRSTGLRPGTYSMVLYGARSNMVAIATFYVW